MRSTLALFVTAALLLLACEARQLDERTVDEVAEPVADHATEAASARPLVVSTSPVLSDLARQVLGERGTVYLLPPFGDDVLLRLADADVVVAGGLFHDDRWIEYAEINLREQARLLRVADDLVARDMRARAVSFSEQLEAFQPHLWRDVTYAVDFVEQIRDGLTEVDPAGAQAYARNAADYSNDLAALDRAIAEATGTIPGPNRQVLVAAHSWEPFGHRYGLTVVPAVPVSDWSEPSPGDLRRLARQVRELAVTEVFGSQPLPQAVVERIAAETGATYVGALTDADLPAQQVDDRPRAFVEMMAHDVRILVDRLEGDSAALEGLTP